MSATCRSCGAEIIWALTVSGKRMPLDPLPLVSEGTRFVVVDPASTAALRVVVASGFEPGMRSHFASCVDADKHRRPR